MTTATSKITKGGLRLIGIPGRGKTLSAEDSQDALDALTMMIQNWMLEKLMVHVITQNEFTLSAGTAGYVIKSGAVSPDFDKATPPRIEESRIKDSNGNHYGVEIIDRDCWNRINDYTVQGRPFQLYYEYMETIGEGYINLFYTPNTAETIVLDLWEAFVNPTTLTENIDFPDVYARAFKFNLAVELAPEYGRSVRPEVAVIARESKDIIKKFNFKPMKSTVDAGLLRRRSGYNINTG